MTARFCDELPFGFGWIAEHPRHLRRASHALADDGQVWLVDSVDALEVDERVRAFGKLVGVIQLLDRHGRDSVALARRWDVPLYHAPTVGVPDSPFHVLRAVNLPMWRESALWWPEQKTLIVADALGTASYFLGRRRAARGASAPPSVSTAFTWTCRSRARPVRTWRGDPRRGCSRSARRGSAECAQRNPALARRPRATRSVGLILPRREARYCWCDASRPRTTPKTACRQVACANARGFVSSGGIPGWPRAGW